MGKDWQQEATKNQKKEGGGVRRFKIAAPTGGDKTKVKIRIPVNNFEPAWCHWFPGFDSDGNESDRFAVCLGKKKGDTMCPICKKFEETGDNGYKASKRYFINVIDRNAEKAECKLWTCSPSMFNQIAEIADPDEGMSDPTTYDLVIIRKGAKFKDTRYTVKPAMKDGKVIIKKISGELEELLSKDPEEGGPYPLDKFVEKKTVDELEAMLSGKKKSKSDDEDEDDAPKKKKKPADDDEDEDDIKPKKKHADEDEDEDEDDAPKKKKKHSDDDDEDEDDAPKKKKKSSDDDEDEDDAPKKKKKPADDDEDEDEDDAPKKKKKPVDDDDEDEDDEE